MCSGDRQENGRKWIKDKYQQDCWNIMTRIENEQNSMHTGHECIG